MAVSSPADDASGDSGPGPCRNASACRMAAGKAAAHEATVRWRPSTRQADKA
jgi:hypothetical protein